MTRSRRRATVTGTILAIFSLMACAHQGATKEKTEKKDVAPVAHAFRGKVELVDLKTRTLTVNGEDVPGWMPAMTMIYNVDKPDVFEKIKASDEITAHVYDGDFNTLHDVQVMPAKNKQ